MFSYEKIICDYIIDDICYDLFFIDYNLGVAVCGYDLEV